MESFEAFILASVSGMRAIRFSVLSSSETAWELSSSGGGISLSSTLVALIAASLRQLSELVLLPHFTRKALKPFDLRVGLLKYHSPLFSPVLNKSTGAFRWLLFKGAGPEFATG